MGVYPPADDIDWCGEWKAKRVALPVVEAIPSNHELETIGRACIEAISLERERCLRIVRESFEEWEMDDSFNEAIASRIRKGDA